MHLQMVWVWRLAVEMGWLSVFLYVYRSQPLNINLILYMRPLPNPKTLIYFDNAECRCFQSTQPQHQYFLNKNQIPANLNEKNKIPISENIKHTLSKTIVKRSLKRVGSPPTNEVMRQRGVEVDEKSPFRGSIRRNTQDLPFLLSHKSPMNSYELKRQNANLTTINFNRPIFDNNTSIKPNSPSFQPQPYQQTINHQKRVSAISYTANPFERIEISKISFNFVPTVIAHQQSPRLIEKTATNKSLQNLQSQVTLPSEKKSSQPEKGTVKKGDQQIKIPRLKKKESLYQCFDLGSKQTATKNSMLYSGVNTSPDNTDIGDMIQMTETAAGMREYSELDNVNSAPKISQTTVLKQNTYKSVLKSKRSLLSDTNRTKLVARKQKPKTLLSRMQDVEQIRSLANSEQEDHDSDKQSVVLGRLEEYNQAKLNTVIRKNTAPAGLERSLEFIQNENSLIMNSTFGEWKHEFESYYGY